MNPAKDSQTSTCRRLPVLTQASIDSYLSFGLGGASAFPPITNNPAEFDVRDSRWVDASRQNLVNILRSNLDILSSNQPATLPNSVAYRIVFSGHGQTDTNASKALAGWLSGPLNESGESLARSQDPDYHSLVITSDLPRAIQHALIKYCRHDIQAMVALGNLVNEWEADFKTRKLNYNQSATGFPQKMARLALDNGIIPVSLLRAQSFMYLELFLSTVRPKKDDDQEKIAFLIKQRRHELEEAGFPNIEFQMDFLINEAARRRDSAHTPLFEGRTFAESYLRFGERSLSIWDSLFDGFQTPDYQPIFKNIEIIGHSGYGDLLRAKFARQTSESLPLYRSQTKDARGSRLLIHLNKDLKWLDNPAVLDNIVSMTEVQVDKFQEQSHDKKIQSGDGIMLAGFYREEKPGPDGKTNKVEVLLPEIVQADKIIQLVEGICGLGKTTFSLDLARRLTAIYHSRTDGRDYKKLADWVKDSDWLNALHIPVPVLVRLRDLHTNDSAHRSQESLENALSASVSSFSKEQIEQYRADGYRFVFILDGLDEVTSDYQLKLQKALPTLRELGNVVVSSRPGGQVGCDGLSRIFLNPEMIVKNTPAYLNARIADPAALSKFAQYVEQQSPEIRKNWLMISILTKMYTSDPALIDFSKPVSPDEIKRAGIEMFIWDHALEKDQFGELYTKPGDEVLDPAIAVAKRQQWYFDQLKRKAEPARVVVYQGSIKEWDLKQAVQDYEAVIINAHPSWGSDGTLSQDQYQLLCDNLFKAAKAGYLAKVMPAHRRIAAYMTLKDQPVISRFEAEQLIQGNWSLRSELDFRQGTKPYCWINEVKEESGSKP